MGNRWADEKPDAGWRVLAAGLFLALLLFGPIALVATMANSPPRDVSAADFVTTESVAVPVARGGLADTGDIGDFAFGYVEFDVEPKSPGGLPGLGSWPPASGRQQ